VGFFKSACAIAFIAGRTLSRRTERCSFESAPDASQPFARRNVTLG
jgi:hypothetical protein